MSDANLKVKEVTIRKARQCVGCAEKFEPGSKMIYFVAVFQGDFQTSYFCKPCNAYMDKYNDFEDGITFGELRGEEHYENFKKEYNADISNDSK